MSSVAPTPGRDGDRRRTAARLALPAFAAGKTLSIIVILGTVWMQSRTPGFPQRHEFLDAFAQWDGQSYLHIADHGYPAGPLDVHAGAPGHYWGYFPGFPMLVHAVAVALRNPTLSAVVVNVVAELVALYYIALLVLEVRDGDERQAGVCLWLIALYPYGAFLTVAYTEAPFLAAAAAALYFACSGRETAAWGAAAIAVAMRVTGVALLPALLWEHLRRRGWRPGAQLAGVLVAAAPVGLFMLWARHETGDALAFFHIEQSESFGNRGLVNPLTGLHNTWNAATSGGEAGTNFIFFMECVFGVAGFLALLAMISIAAIQQLAPRQGHAQLARRLAPHAVPMALVLYSIGVWALPVSLTYWLSVPRYMLAMLPATLLVSPLLARRRDWRWAVTAVSAGLLAWGCSVFASGRFLA